MMPRQFPEEFKEKMHALLGAEAASFFDSLEGIAPVSVRLNPGKPTAQFSDTTSVPWSLNGYYLKERPSFTLDPSFHAGAYYVQEASSMFLEKVFLHLFSDDRPLHVLDLCAAPGGKTTHLLSLLPPGSTLVANEIIPSRNKILQENLIRWGDARVMVTQNKAEDFVKAGCLFDLVLIDAPCSGEGLFRKDPDAVKEWSPAAVLHCAERQSAILQHARSLIRSGGAIIYSTCTYEQSENEQQIENLLKDYSFKLDLPLSAENGIVKTDFGFRFYPNRVNGEGFFISAVRYEGDSDSENFRFKEMRKEKKLMDCLEKYLINAEAFTPWLLGEKLFAIPDETQKLFRQAEQGALYIRQAGIFTGTFKGNDFIPSHDLAMSTNLRQDIPDLEVSKENALSYLRGESVNAASENSGWHLLRFNGLPLGWVKILKDRINNYFPKEYRIRMK